MGRYIGYKSMYLYHYLYPQSERDGGRAKLVNFGTPFVNLERVYS